MTTASRGSLRAVTAFFAGLALLLALNATAQAATFSELAGAGSGTTVALSPAVSITPGTVTQDGDTLEISNATVKYGEVGTGEGVSATATGATITLSGGSFTFPEEIAKGTFTVDSDDPVTFGLGASTESTGTLIPVTTDAPTTMRAFAGIGQGDAEDAAGDVLPFIPADNGPNFYTIDVACCGSGGTTLGLNLRQKVRRADNTVAETGRVLVRVNLANRRYSVQVINWKFSFNGSESELDALVSGEDILNPFEFTQVKGTLTGETVLAKGLTLTGGELTWDKTGFHVAGGVRIDCLEGDVTASLTGDIIDNTNWNFAVSGQTNGGCKVANELSLPTGDLAGEITSEDGNVTGEFEVGGMVSTTLLPAGVNQWDARFRFQYAGVGQDADSKIEFYASAGIGTVLGFIAFDGTLALNADFTIPFADGSNVAFDGDIKRETPGGPVVYDVGGSVSGISLAGKGTVGGSLRLTNSSLTFAGDISASCPVSGSITAGVSGDIPLTPATTNWSLSFNGSAPQGCGITNELALSPGSGATGILKSTAGKFSTDINASATINTTLVPTKTSFTVGFALKIAPGTYSVAANGSTQGASFSGNVASNGTFGIAFSITDLKLGDVTLGANGNVSRTTPNGALAYSISGTLAGQAKIYDNLYLRGGSVGISNTGGLTFSGTVRQICTKGYLDATASGAIVNSKNWSFTAKGLASSCTIGRAALFNGTLFSANIKSEDGKVLYNASLNVSRINLFSTNVLFLGSTTTWLTNVGGSISNTCAGCYEGQRTRLTFTGTGNVQWKILFIPLTSSATLGGSVDIQGTSVKKVAINVNVNLFSNVFAANQLAADTEKGFTT